MNDQYTNDLIFSGHLPLTDQADIIIITHPNDVKTTSPMVSLL